MLLQAEVAQPELLITGEVLGIAAGIIILWLVYVVCWLPDKDEEDEDGLED